MNKTLNTLAIAAAACLAFGGAAQAGSMGYPQGYAAQDFDDTRVITERRVVRQQPTYVVRDDDEGFAERVVKFPFRTARTVARTPVIVGESLAGRREIISDRGFMVRDGDRRLSSRRLDWDDNRRLSRRDWNDNRFSRGVVRTGRTITRTPVIVGETLTGDREIVNDNGRLFYYDR